MIKPYFETKLGKLYHGDCLEIMPQLETTVDMVLCDPPYGTTACKWDSIIPLDEMWACVWRVLKKNGAAVFTASQPFTGALTMSAIERFKHRWVWDKVKPSTGLHAKVMPLQVVEDVVIFGRAPVAYNPQMVEKKRRKEDKFDSNGEAFGGKRTKRHHDNRGLGYPKNLIKVSNADQRGRVHPTQKPVALFAYLISTYTNAGETVLDFCLGSGTTAIACEQLGRKWIGIEREEQYCEIAAKRLSEPMQRSLLA